MTGDCTFPRCDVPGTGTNRANQVTCDGHKAVVVCGSYVNDKHTDGGHG